jgi:hypothetical protein
VLLSRTGLLKLRAAFIDGRNRAEFVNFGVDAEVFTRAQSKMFQIFGVGVLSFFIFN